METEQVTKQNEVQSVDPVNGMNIPTGGSESLKTKREITAEDRPKKHKKAKYEVLVMVGIKELHMSVPYRDYVPTPDAVMFSWLRSSSSFKSRKDAEAFVEESKDAVIKAMNGDSSAILSIGGIVARGTLVKAATFRIVKRKKRKISRQMRNQLRDFSERTHEVAIKNGGNDNG